MKRIACWFTCLAALAACQRGGDSAVPPVPSAYRADIENLCDVVVRSGADKLDVGERALTIANWLSANLRTKEAHDYLIKIQPLTGEPKAAALEAEARRVGLSRCALAAEWRAPAQPATTP